MYLFGNTLTKEHVKAFLTLSGIQHIDIWCVPNEYWGGSKAEYHQKLAKENPWFMIHLYQDRYLKMGMRKRVIEIQWTETPLRKIISEDSVTKDLDYIHAWTYPKVLEYMITLRKLL